MFTAALYTITRAWKQPNWPLKDKWIKMYILYTMEYYSVIKKDRLASFAVTWMGIEIVILSEISHTEKGKCHMVLHTYAI